MSDRMILTGASASYGPSLLALLGSLDANWPAHPQVRIYDLGLDDATRQTLADHNCDVVEVPAFCSHWREHFTWKPWAWREAPADHVLWLDAGLVILRPMREAFDTIRRDGYFAVATSWSIETQASEAAYRACQVEQGFRGHLPGTATGNIGFDKTSPIDNLLEELHKLTLTEENVKAVEPSHRHEQALISLLLQRDFSPVHHHDTATYIGWESSEQTFDQATWVHRRQMHPRDLQAFADCIGQLGSRYQPRFEKVTHRPTLKQQWWKLRRRLLSKPNPNVAAPYNGVRDVAPQPSNETKPTESAA